MVDLAILILRVVSGGLFLMFHSWIKVIGLYNFLSSGNWKLVNTLSNIGFPLPVLFAMLFTVFEFFSTIFLIVGFMSRVSAGILSVLVLIYIYFHSKFGLSIVLLILYLVIFVALFIIGGGRFSADALLRRK